MTVSKVLVGGCFDILHFGHIHFLKSAKSLGNYLVVALESDVNVKKLKGTQRPIHNQSQRKEALESLNFVDEVITLQEMKSDKDYEQLVIDVSPSILALTEGDPMIEKKRSHAKKVNAKVVEIPKIKSTSTSQIAKLLEIE
ncbi:MAG: adenylyltransferase/cytidyltransferase family protein [Microgenomates group bacterium]